MITHLLELFFPKTCAGCDSLLLSGETVICTSCRHEIPLTNHYLSVENEAFRKFYGKIPVETATCFMYYHKKGIVQQLIHKLKYKGQQAVGTAIGYWFAEDLKKSTLLNGIDAIVPVPLHTKRLRKRGYNQVTAFGEALSNAFEIPLNDQLLVRKVYSKTQTKKNLLNRIDVGNQQVFDVNFEITDHNKHYLLIDDVLTTGSTLEACSRALLLIPGIKISILCMAMSH